MDELTIGDKTYISSKQAAKITGYAKDYVGQLCREGRVEARLVGRNWYVLESSIREHRFGVSAEAQPAEQEAPAVAAYTWTPPVYQAEEPVLVPNIPAKEPEIVASRKIVSEMQTAWQEWFAELPRMQTAQDTSIPEEPAPAEAEAETEEVEESVGEDGVKAPVLPAYTPHERLQMAAVHEVMDLTPHNSYREELVQEAVPEAEQYAFDEDVESTASHVQKRSYGLIRSALAGAAVIAVVVALLGSGVVGDVLKQHAGNAATAQVGKFLGGESEHKNSK